MPPRGQSHNRVEANSPVNYCGANGVTRSTSRRSLYGLRGTLAADCGTVIGESTTEVKVDSEVKRQRVDVVIQTERLQSGRFVAVQESDDDGGVRSVGE